MRLIQSTFLVIRLILLIGSVLLYKGTDFVEAQEQDSIPGVTLGLLYESEFYPALAVHPFEASPSTPRIAQEIETIIANDLRYSDRFEVMDSIPEGIVGDGIDYQLWDQLGAVWLLSGSVETQLTLSLIHI